MSDQKLLSPSAADAAGEHGWAGLCGAACVLSSAVGATDDFLLLLHQQMAAWLLRSAAAALELILLCQRAESPENLLLLVFESRFLRRLTLKREATHRPSHFGEMC